MHFEQNRAENKDKLTYMLTVGSDQFRLFRAQAGSVLVLENDSSTSLSSDPVMFASSQFSSCFCVLASDSWIRFFSSSLFFDSEFVFDWRRIRECCYFTFWNAYLLLENFNCLIWNLLCCTVGLKQWKHQGMWFESSIHYLKPLMDEDRFDLDMLWTRKKKISGMKGWF